MIDYDPNSEAVQRDPYPTYKRLRDESPVHWVESYRGWALSRFADQWDLTQDNEHLTTRDGTTLWVY